MSKLFITSAGIQESVDKIWMLIVINKRYIIADIIINIINIINVS